VETLTNLAASVVGGILGWATIEGLMRALEGGFVADKPVLLLNVSPSTQHFNCIALSFVESGIPHTRLAAGEHLTVHKSAGRDDQTLCGKLLDKLLFDDEYWSLRASDVTCPACRRLLSA
jgi:hypothetical protein